MQLIRQRPERRRWKRHWLNAPIRVFTDSTVIDGRSIRLSEGGIYLFALANLAAGDEIRIEYPASESDEPLSRSGFFFQAEDGIRDVAVTGVQTCALPI